MNKILKILSILVIGFVMFSCSTPTNDSTPYIPDESGTETPVETPTDEPVEETTEVQTYSVIFIAKKLAQQPIADLLNSSPDYKNLEEGTEVELPTVIYLAQETEQLTLEPIDSTTNQGIISYEGDVTSVVIGNEDVEIKCWVGGFEVLKK